MFLSNLTNWSCIKYGIFFLFFKTLVITHHAIIKHLAICRMFQWDDKAGTMLCIRVSNGRHCARFAIPSTCLALAWILILCHGNNQNVFDCMANTTLFWVNPIEVDSRALQTSNISIWRYHCLGYFWRWHFWRFEINIDYRLIQCIRGFRSSSLPIFKISLL